MIRKFIATYRKRRIDADEIRRALVVDEQLKAQRERDEHQKQAYYEKIIVALDRIHNQQDTYSEQQKADNDRRNTRERNRFWLDIAAIIVAAIAACILFGQENIMSGQLDQMRAEQRPWIWPTITVLGIQYTDPQILVGVKVTMKNVGSLPARGAMPTYHVMLDKRHGDETISAQHVICDGARTISDHKFGFFMFPGQDAEISQYNPVTDKPIFEHSAKGITKEPKRDVRFLVIGCVTYQFVSDAMLHQTRFIYYVLRKDGGNISTYGPDVYGDDLRPEPYIDARAFYAD